MSSGFALPIAVFTGKLVNQELLRQHVVPWVQRDIVWRKIRLLADSAPASATQITLRPLVEFWFLTDWPPYSSDLNSLGLSHAFCSQKARPHLTLMGALRPFVAVEWAWLAVVQIRKTCRSFAAAVKLLLRNMKLTLNKWFFSGLTWASIKHEGLYMYIDKKHFSPWLTAPPCTYFRNFRELH